VGGAKLYAGEKALSSIYHSLLSGIMYSIRTNTMELVVLQRMDVSSKWHVTVDSLMNQSNISFIIPYIHMCVVTSSSN
jgi:hypothetical protein